jgi:predicted nucleotidyltransferase
MGKTESAGSYEACLNSFVRGVLDQSEPNVRCIILYGGLVRDKEPIPGWSDIDLLIVFKEISKRDAGVLSELIDSSEKRFGLRIDLTQLDEKWLEEEHLRRYLYNSEVINALAMRPDVSRIIYGNLPHVSISAEQEKIAARFYVSHTLSAVHRYLVQDAMHPTSRQDTTRHVARLTRWVFSIIRASLRLFDIYVHPYRPSLLEVERLFPHLDLAIPYLLLSMRHNPGTISADTAFYASVERFLEEYTTTALRKARTADTMHNKGVSSSCNQ